MAITLRYKLEFTIGAEDDDEDKAAVDERIQTALRRIGATLVGQEIEEED